MMDWHGTYGDDVPICRCGEPLQRDFLASFGGDQLAAVWVHDCADDVRFTMMADRSKWTIEDAPAG